MTQHKWRGKVKRLKLCHKINIKMTTLLPLFRDFRSLGPGIELKRRQKLSNVTETKSESQSNKLKSRWPGNQAKSVGDKPKQRA